MRRMARPAINSSNSLFIAGCRVANACQNTKPDKRCQEAGILIFFRCIINDAHSAATHGRQLLHLKGIRWTDAWLVLCTLLGPANKWTFQAQAQYLRGRVMNLVLYSANYPPYLL